jgi:hypothetical protein
MQVGSDNERRSWKALFLRYEDNVRILLLRLSETK